MRKIIIENISKSYGRVNVLKSIDLEISTGMFGLLGKNGAGKTTLMRILATVLLPNSGQITYQDIVWSKYPDKVRKIIGYLPQEFGVFRNISANECLEYIARLKGMTNKKERMDNIEQVLNQVNLLAEKDKKVGKFSGGMRRRLGIAQALLNDPQILIVDEPTSGLDPEERIRFRNLLRQLSQNRIVLLSTHIVEDIEAICNQVACMKNGNAAQFSSLHELAQTAKNKVWLWKISHKDYQNLEQEYQVISSKVQIEHVELRVISEAAPSNDAVSVDPSIEEGYLLWNQNE